jgi:hypothetical protein
MTRRLYLCVPDAAALDHHDGARNGERFRHGGEPPASNVTCDGKHDLERDQQNHDAF